MNIVQKVLRVFCHLLAITVLLTPIAAYAGTVQQVGITNMITESELVVHGEVIDRWYEYGDDESQIFTHVLIRVIDVIKGNAADDSIELKFLGGTLGRLNLKVSDQFVPAVGDEAVYFIENPHRLQVNPLYGWRQGHFPVRYDEFAKERFALTHDLHSIYDVLEESTPPGIELTKGIATGISINPLGDRVPLTLAEFKHRLRDHIERLE